MNPTLTEWLAQYNEARAQYRDETRLLPVDALMPERPREMQFTLTSTGLLRDADGARVGHVSEMGTSALNALGLEYDRLTARQRRGSARTPQPATDAPRAWPEEAIPEDAAPGDIVVNGDNRRIGIVGRNGRNEVVVVRDPSPMHDRLRRPLATLTLDENGVAVLQGNPPVPEELRAPPTEEELRAALGTPAVTGLDVEQERTIMESLNAAMNAQPNPFVTGPIRLDQIHMPNMSASTVSYDRISNALSSVSETIASNMGTSRERALDAAEAAMTGREPEVYVGPRMLATIGIEPGSAERYTEHTATTEAALLRAGQTYHNRPTLYGPAVRRAAREETTAAIVDRNAAAVSGFLIRGYGVELNEEALTAVSAMTATFVRQGTLPFIRRAETAETTAATERAARDALTANVASLDREVITLQNRVRELEADAQHAGTVVGGVLTAPAPGTVEAAFLAAKAWKETGHEDSVAKLASFKHLLDTLENLAR